MCLRKKQRSEYLQQMRLNFCIKSTMSRLKHLLFLTAMAGIIVSCDGLKMTKNIFETSERARYERSFSGADSLMAQWKAGFTAASASRLKITDGTSLTMTEPGNKAVYAAGYSMELKKGDLLVIEAVTATPEAKIFTDILEENTDTDKPESGLLKNNRFTRFTESSGWHKIIIQPEIGYRGTLELKIYTQPSLAFPVAGKANRDVQSFWGASRDGGGRSHEGVDIFASRGTPVVAVTSGFVTRTGNQGLGGKQVWLRDGVLGNSYYYAHLDSVMTTDGSQVKTGDTLGRVGNTGNAAGGPAHLHFGIYTAGGAVDPYPYIRKREAPAFKNSSKIISEQFIKAGTTLRTGPGSQYDVVIKAEHKTSVKVIAAIGSWCHVRIPDGTEGFVSAERILQ